MSRSVRASLSIASAILCAFAISACSGSRPQDADPVDSGSSLGEPCQFDSDCEPPGAPEAICGAEGTCIAGCATSGCPTGDSCNSSTGHCAPRTTTDAGTHPDAGTDAGTPTDAGEPDGGETTDGGGTLLDGGSASTLCEPCTSDGDCQDNGLCIPNPTNTYMYCTQDCTQTGICPSGYLCATNNAGTLHQCYPSAGSCTNLAPDGGTPIDGGTEPDGGTSTGPTDPNDPSTNTGGTDQCTACNVNNDCIAGAICFGSSDTGAMDGTCEKGCDESNEVTIPLINLMVYPDCVTGLCEQDILNGDFTDAASDCLIDYSTCGNVAGTNATFCSGALGCGNFGGTFP